MDFKIKVHEKWNKNFRGGGSNKNYKACPPQAKFETASLIAIFIFSGINNFVHNIHVLLINTEIKLNIPKRCAMSQGRRWGGGHGLPVPPNFEGGGAMICKVPPNF